METRFRRIFPVSLIRSVFLSALLLSVLVSGCSREAPDGQASDGKAPVAAEAPTSQAPASRDVVLITVDTLRFDALGFSAAPGTEPSRWQTETPALEQLAAQGRVFDLAVAHAPLTLPSHASLLTGLYPYQHGVRENAGFVLPSEARTLAERLKAHGYQTAAFVSAYVLDGRFGLAQGFDVYGDDIERGGEGSFQVSERPGHETVAAASAWWKSSAGDAPRFLWVHLFDPHAPYAPPADLTGDFEHPYQGEVAAVDGYLAPLLDAVADTGRRPLILFTSDHGEGLGDHGEETHGIFAYQSTLQVPFVLWGDGVESGRDARLVRHVDWVPTVLDGAGLPADSSLPGRSLLQTSVAGDGASGDAVESYFEALSGTLNRGWAPLRGWIRGPLKYIELPEPELYDLQADPMEAQNLTDDRRRDLQFLRARLPEESVWPPARQSLSSEETARLRSLGYLSDDGGAKVTFSKADDPKRLVDLDRDIHRFSEAFARGDFDEAVRLARSLVERRPSMAVGHTQLAQALLEAGRRDEAIAAMQNARKKGWAGPSLLRQLGLSLLEEGRPQEAASVLRPVAEGGDPEAMGALAMALTEMPEPSEASVAEARSLLKQALEAAPGDPGLQEKAAVAALRRGDGAEALVHAKKAKELRPTSASAWNQYGVALYLQGRPMEALEAWQRSVALDPDAFDTLFNLGTKAVELGREDLARRYLEDFARRAPRERYGQDLERVEAWLKQSGP